MSNSGDKLRTRESNPIEFPPKKDPKATAKAIGQTAVKGAMKDKNKK